VVTTVRQINLDVQGIRATPLQNLVDVPRVIERLGMEVELLVIHYINFSVQVFGTLSFLISINSFREY
jgi:hypothetical protein